MPRSLLGLLLGLRGKRGKTRAKRPQREQVKGGGAAARVALDVEALAPRPRLRREAVHAAAEDEGGVGPSGRSFLSRLRPGRRRVRETPEEKRVRRLLEKQQQAQGEQSAKQEQQSMEFARKQILEAVSSSDLLERAENLIEEDWLGKIDAMPGNMFTIGAFGDLNLAEPATSLKGLKAKVRWLGCVAIAFIQLIGPPAILFSTIFSWGIQSDRVYEWKKWDVTNPDIALSDWEHMKATKVLGMAAQFCFILNALFLVLDEKQSWFKIYNIHRYLMRSTPNFDLSGQHFLYLGAFINNWAVLWCCLSSYVVVGASQSPKAVLFDALGLLFIYNLDDIGGDLGFVDEDDWPGERLGWIFEEMVKKDWHPADWESEAAGAEAGALVSARSGVEGGASFVEEDAGEDGEDYVGGETQDWGLGGWLVLYWYYFTIVVVTALVLVLPLLSAYTPFTLIVPADD
mmetsp:Transcript_70078/g.212019  ORF Transcript_70078/g.212019 Transcript_70078/m.212019 type:complete len:458 (+) Transcript_70078:79-1452(+)